MIPSKTAAPNVRHTEGEDRNMRVSRKQYEKRTKRRQMLWTEGAPCSLCGLPITQNQMSKNAYERDIEETWCVHIECRKKILNRLDRDSGMADIR